MQSEEIDSDSDNKTDYFVSNGHSCCHESYDDDDDDDVIDGELMKLMVMEITIVIIRL